MKEYKTVDNGMLQSALVLLANNATNKNIYKILAESPKYQAKFTITKDYGNGIKRIGMELADGSFEPAIAFLPDVCEIPLSTE